MTKTKDYKNSNLNPLKIKFAGKIPAKNQSKRVAQWRTKMKIQDSGYIPMEYGTLCINGREKMNIVKRIINYLATSDYERKRQWAEKYLADSVDTCDLEYRQRKLTRLGLQFPSCFH